jgi:hypothetical protein
MRQDSARILSKEITSASTMKNEGGIIDTSSSPAVGALDDLTCREEHSPDGVKAI